MENSTLKITKSYRNFARDKTESLNSKDVSRRTLTVVGKVSERSMMLRLREMERINSFLEKLVEQRTLRLSEVIATNTKFLSILAHDLRSPFNSILCTLEIIKDNLNIAADIQMIRTVLRNLISNAIKYTNTGGEINISALEREKYVEIAVKDNGIGISRANQRNLFRNDGFYSKPGTNNEKGTGLGLLLCKEFIELHGGHIRIQCIGGKGC